MVGTLCVHHAHFDGAAVVGAPVGFRVGTTFGCEGLDAAAVGVASAVVVFAAHVEIDGERTLVKHIRLTDCLTVAERGVMRCMVGWGWGREGGNGEVPPGYNSRNDDR